jgi:hypothetical protein
MFRLTSALFNLAAAFTGKFKPFQGVTLTPHAGGVAVTSSDRGAASFYGFDPNGYAPRAATFSPGKELATACKGIKTAARELIIEGSLATVTTYYKEHSTAKDFQILQLDDAPPMRAAIRGAMDFWGDAPALTTTAGRYDLDLLTKACKTLAEETDQLVLSGYDGGPLRLQSDKLRCVVLLMPQTAQPLPPLPPWLADFAAGAAHPIHQSSPPLEAHV